MRLSLKNVRIPLAFAVVLGAIVWVTLLSGGNPDPTAPHASATVGILDIGVLVFREGLECILVLAAITASLNGSTQPYQRPIAAGAGLAFLASLLTWAVAIRIIDDLSGSIPALDIQAATGLLAILVLVIVMNWFFHKLYWTGWISMHNRRKQQVLQGAGASKLRLWWGLGLLGFTSLYREGFEVVLFLQSYRLRLGGTPVFYGVLLGLLFTSVVAVLTFVAHRRLPYRRMLVLTGVMLGVVLVVMVGEQAQEMQLAHWIPTTAIPALATVLPAWAGLWFACFPTVETLAAQGIAIVLVLGSYIVARLRERARVQARPQEPEEPAAAGYVETVTSPS
ncbi:MAG: FTR1 family protein [Acidobacteriota bacterium]|nr:FTR1 family protein [Acidobacteriota bacterium]